MTVILRGKVSNHGFCHDSMNLEAMPYSALDGDPFPLLSMFARYRHPNVVRYFVRELSGEFVYLALQLCQLSLHNAMAQIHSAMVRDITTREEE